MLGLPSGSKLSRTRVEPKQSLKTLRKHRAERMENFELIRTSNAGYVIAASKLNLVIAIFLQKIFLIRRKGRAARVKFWLKTFRELDLK